MLRSNSNSSGFLFFFLVFLFLIFVPRVVVRQRQRDRVPPATCHAHHPPPVGPSWQRNRNRSVRVALVARAEPAERAAAPGEELAVPGQGGGVGASGGGLDDGDAVEGADLLGGEAGGARAVAEAEPGEKRFFFFLVFSFSFSGFFFLSLFLSLNNIFSYLPYSPRPHTNTPPSLESASECHPPAVMSAAPPAGNPTTFAGCVSYVVEPVPNCPKSLMPQARTSPPSSSTRVWKAPQASLAARGR